MKAILILFASIVLVAMLAAHGAAATDSGAEGAKVLGTVTEGNTIIVFEAANNKDLDLEQLKIWGQFAEEHPEIARALEKHPSRIKNASFLKKHPELKEFLSAHPDIEKAMVENPGNFVAR